MLGLGPLLTLVCPLHVAQTLTLNPIINRLQVRLGPSGVEEVLGLGPLSPLEEKGVADLIPVLKKNIDTGVAFAQTPPKKT